MISGKYTGTFTQADTPNVEIRRHKPQVGRPKGADWCSGNRAVVPAVTSGLRVSDLERFWAAVDKSAGPGDCWGWTGWTHPFGYGQIWMQGRTVYAHRFSFELHNGPLPEGIDALHRCDNPPCTNPAHLFAGTPLDNTRDMISKGRAKHSPVLGSRNGVAKLTEDQIAAIFAMRASGTIHRDVAAAFGVSLSTIDRIAQQRGWRHASSAIPGAGDRMKSQGSRHGRAKLTDEQVARIFAMRSEGAIHNAIAAEVGISPSQISRILARKSWKHADTGRLA